MERKSQKSDKHFTRVEKKNSFLTGRNLDQNQVWGGAAICHDQFYKYIMSKKM